MVSILLNAAIAVLSVYAWISLLLGNGDDRSLMTYGWRSLKYYTVLSNLSSGAVSLAYAAYCLLVGGMAPVVLLTLKLAAASVVMITFLTVVLFLGPTMGWAYMYRGGNFWMHLALPLMAAVDVTLFIPMATLPFVATLAPVVFTAVYAVGYVTSVCRHLGQQDIGKYDFYGFLRWGEDKIGLVAAFMLFATWVVAAVLYGANHLLCVG